MNIFKHRPLALGCALFLALLYIFYLTDAAVPFIAAAFGVCVLLLLIVFWGYARKEQFTNAFIYLIPISIAIILSSVLSLASFHKDRTDAYFYVGKDGVYEMDVESVSYESDFKSVYVAYSREIRQRIAITTYGEKLLPGQRIKADITEIKSIEGVSYSEAEYYESNGVYLTAECNDVIITDRDDFSLKGWLYELNFKMCKRIASFTNSNTSSIVSALFLGNKKDLDLDTRRDFARLGISHILALSGMHLTIIVSIVSGALSVLKAGKRNKYILTLLVIAFYIGLTGFSESTLRAGGMLFLLYTMYYFKVRADFITDIFLSVTIICIISPYSIMSVSLMLSFFAMLGCVLSSFIMAKSRIHGEIMRKIVGGIVTTISVSLITLPIMFARFGFISVIAPVCNLVIIPLFTVLLIISPLLLALGGFGFIGKAIVWVCEGLTYVIMEFVEYFAKYKGIVFSIHTDLHKYAIIIIFVSICLLMMLGKRKAFVGLSLMLIGVSLLVYQNVAIANDRIENTYVHTVGNDKGDRTYLESGGEICIIDSSNLSKSSVSEPYKRSTELGYTEIGMYVLSDYSEWSYDALDMLTDEAYVRRVCLPVPVDGGEAEKLYETSKMLTDKGVKVLIAQGRIEFMDADIIFGPNEYTSRSTKRLISYSIEGSTSRYTYIGSSVWENKDADDFARSYGEASDVIYFGCFGPKFKYRYKYDLTNVKYCVFSTKAAYYSNCDTESVRTVMQGRRFNLR